MAAPIYLGEETSAAGWRIAGVLTVVPAEGLEVAAFIDACARAPLVLVAASVAARIPEAVLRAAQTALKPLTLIVPDLSGGSVPDVATRLRRQLGLDE
jgi:vacuolar-type H+-ATPase subunit F/Vma7